MCYLSAQAPDSPSHPLQMRIPMYNHTSHLPFPGACRRLLLGAVLLGACTDLPNDPSPPASASGAGTSAVTYITSIPIKQKERIHVTVTGAAAERCVSVAVSGAVAETLFSAVGPCNGAGAGGGTGLTKTSAMAAAAGALTFGTSPAGAGARISVVPDSVQTYRVELDDGSGALDHSDVVLRVEVLASVTDFGATGADQTNDHPALQALINDARGYANIYFPSGTYHVDDRILVRRSNLRLWGNIGVEGTPNSRLFARFRDSLSIIDIEAHNHEWDPSARLKNVTVERLFFQGTGQTWAFGVLVVSSDSVNVRRNRARNIGLASGVAAGGEPTRNLRIEHNLVDNDPSYLKPGTFGVLLNQGTDTATVRDNEIYWVSSGIQWWGGGADPKEIETYDPLRRKRAKNLTIHDNVVKYVSAGIWGGNGDSIKVTDNYVQSCQDVCLDAEGSNNVLFEGNTAKYAGQSVLASFYFSTGVVFRNNTVEQDGTQHDVPAIGGARAPWQGMFALLGHNQDQDSITTRLVGNRFIFTPAGPGVGRLYKESSRFMAVDSNTMSNTVIEMAYNNNGVVQVTGNTMTFSRSTDTFPAIMVGSNHNAPGLPAGSAYITGNVVRSSVLQSGQGIEAWQWAWGPAVRTYIENNQVSGFATSILYRNDNYEHVWRITGNWYDGRIARSGNTAPSAYVAGNSYTGPVSPLPPCKPGMTCYPT